MKLFLWQSNATSEDIEEVARETFAHEFIAELPDGYDTDVCCCKIANNRLVKVIIFRLEKEDHVSLEDRSSAFCFVGPFCAVPTF